MDDLIEQTIEALKSKLDFYKIDTDADINFVCPGWSSSEKCNLTSEIGFNIVGIQFSAAPDYAFFTGLREILGNRYGQNGKLLVNLLAADFDPYCGCSHAQDYDPFCKEVFKDIKMISLADPNGGTRFDTNVPELVERWSINYSNLAPYRESHIGIHSDSPEFVRMGDPKNPRDADFAWACNVVSYGAVEGWGDFAAKQAQAYQTFAALVEMIKPETGKLLLINTLDRNTHYSIEDPLFRQLLDLEVSKLGGSRFSLFTRTAKTEITDLQLTRYIADNAKRIERWSMLG